MACRQVTSTLVAPSVVTVDQVIMTNDLRYCHTTKHATVAPGFAKLSTIENGDTPIPTPAEYDDTDTDTDTYINAGRDASDSANF